MLGPRSRDCVLHGPTFGLKPPMKPYVIAGGSQIAESHDDFERVIMPTSPVAGPAVDTYI